VALPRSSEPEPQVDDDSTTTARLAYRTALAQRQTARLTLAIAVIGVAAPVIKAIVNALA
jgi:hypothetical protein